jgi:hypothetical protein
MALSQLGTLLHDPVRFTPDDLPEVRTAYFTLLWCFERIYLRRRVMAAGRVPSKRPLRLLDDLVTYQVRYWDENLPAIKQAIEALGDVKDEREREALIKLISDIQGESVGGYREHL